MRFATKFLFAFGFIVSTALAQATGAQSPASRAPASQSLRANDFVAICGDSITEQKLYSVYIEDYLIMCQPQPKLHAAQFGWGGEVVGGFLNRMSNVLRFPVTVATTCYGMNDGGYAALTPERAKAYADGTKAIVETFKKSGVRFIVVGSPGAVDSTTFHVNNTTADVYNKTLAQLTDIAKQVAGQEGVGFADVHSLMMDVMQKSKAKFGKDYQFAGPHGVHPGPNGHLVMAYAFLKALGCDGNIATIKVDLAANTATASDGQKVLSVKDGAVSLESTRYPFCFFGDPKTVDATSGIIQFFPFNQDLNRYMLIVTNAKSPKLRVTWGTKSKEYDAAELAKGVNLAADFLDNPFYPSFKKVEDAVRAQQVYETWLIKSLLHNMPEIDANLPGQKASLDKLAQAGMDKEKSLNDAAVATVQPVRHTITIEPVK